MKRSAVFITVLALALVPVWALAGTVQGTIQGFTCVTQGKVCPIGKEDPMVAAERVFVVFTKDKNYYFVPNIDRGILARHINEEVRIKGDISSKYQSIKAKEFEVFEKGSWRTTWTLEMEEAFKKAI